MPLSPKSFPAARCCAGHAPVIHPAVEGPPRAGYNQFSALVERKAFPLAVGCEGEVSLPPERTPKKRSFSSTGTRADSKRFWSDRATLTPMMPSPITRKSGCFIQKHRRTSISSVNRARPRAPPTRQLRQSARLGRLTFHPVFCVSCCSTLRISCRLSRTGRIHFPADHPYF